MIKTLRLIDSVKLVLLAICLTAVFSTNSRAQWVQLTGLQGEPVYSVRASSSKLFAMTLNGVLSSGNGGATWSKVPALYLTNVIEKMSAMGDTIVMYASPDNYISTNNGATWSELNVPAGAFGSDVVAGNGKIFLPTYGDYLYFSTNAGTSWTHVTANFTTSEMNCLTTEGQNVYIGTDDGVYKSSNGGTSFTFSGLPGEYITTIYTKGQNVFAFGSGVFKSGDNGATWSPFEPLVPYSDITDFYIEGNKVFAATSGDLISSNVLVPNWVTVNLNQDIRFNYSLTKLGSSIFLGCNRGVFVSNDVGLTWNESNNGIIPISTRSITYAGNDTLFAGSSIYGISKYDGASWKFSGIPLLNSNDMLTSGNDVYSASEFGIHRTSDGGQNWDLINNISPNPVITYCSHIAVFDSLILGAALQSGVLRSGDFGSTWTTESTGMAPSLASAVAVVGNNIVAGTYDNGLYTSTDAGFTWTQTGAPGDLINDLTVIGNIIIAASDGSNTTYRSTDQGMTWTPIASNYFDHLSTMGNYVLASGPGYIELSLDSGLTYQFNTPAPTGTAIASSVLSPTDVYVGTYYDGVWKITLFDVTSIHEFETELYSAKMIPNIFHTESWLVVDEKFLSESPNLTISDLNGREISRTPISSTRTTVSSNNLAPGIYFYKVEGSKHRTKAGKMVVY